MFGAPVVSKSTAGVNGDFSANSQEPRKKIDARRGQAPGIEVLAEPSERRQADRSTAMTTVAQPPGDDKPPVESIEVLQKRLQRFRKAIAACVSRNNELAKQVQQLEQDQSEMDLALRAAVDGELTPAETYVAAGVFGLHELSPGNCVIPFTMDDVAPSSGSRDSKYVRVDYHRLDWLPEHCTTAIISRLWMEPSTARHFHLKRVVLNNQFVVLPSRPHAQTVPCELFARDFGSPRFNWRLEFGRDLSLHFINVSDKPRRFHMLALGHYEPSVGD